MEFFATLICLFLAKVACVKGQPPYSTLNLPGILAPPEEVSPDPRVLFLEGAELQALSVVTSAS